MRITDNLLAQQFIARIDQVNEKITQDQTEISSGLRIQSPSDDPAGTVRAAALTSSLSQLTQTTQVATQAQSWLSEEDSTLSQIYTQLQQANTLALQAANPQGTQTSDALATQVDAINSSVLQLANTQFDGSYLFAGYKTNTAPFTETNGTVGYNGDTGVKTVTVGTDETLTLSHPGTAVFGVPAAGATPDPANPSVFTTLSNLSAAIRSGAQSTIQTCLGQLQTQMTNLGNVQAETGTREQQVTLLSNYTAQQQTNLTTALSNTQDADIAQVVIDLQQQQNTYQATTYVTSLLGKEGLLQWLH